ncbi:MAG: lysostaphin resistance A-like protein [Calditrichia bacterium]
MDHQSEPQKNAFINLFKNYEENRLRSLWRLIITTIIFVAAGAALIVPLALMGMQESQSLNHFIVNIACIIGVWLAANWVDRRLFSDTGMSSTSRWWQEFWFGMFLGFALLAAIFTIQYNVGWVTITDTMVTKVAGANFWLALIMPVALYISVGFMEELVFRGYLFLNVAEGIKGKYLNAKTAIWVALILTSAIFGIAHMGNPEASLVSTTNIALAGVMLGLPYILTGRLGMSIGLHITWNFSEGIIFGFPVSGMPFKSAKFLEISQGGPDLWTGGSFGPEAGLLGLFAMIAGMAIMSWYIKIKDGTLTLFTAIAEPPHRPDIVQTNYASAD